MKYVVLKNFELFLFCKILRTRTQKTLHTGAEQKSSILKSYKYLVNVPIALPSAPYLGVVAKSNWIGEIVIYPQSQDFILWKILIEMRILRGFSSFVFKIQKIPS